AVIGVGEEYLRIVSWSYIASGIIFVASSMFQAMGNTIPSLVSSFTRIVGTAVPVMYLSKMPGFTLRWVWLLSAVTIFAQLTISLLLLRREFRRRLAFAADAPAPAAGVSWGSCRRGRLPPSRKASAVSQSNVRPSASQRLP